MPSVFLPSDINPVTDLVIDGETITTTEDHPFWSVTDNQYEPANQLAPGEQVLAASGHTMTVTGLQPTTSRQAPAYNLTVQGIPSYHIGHTETLVHNCPDGGGAAVGKGDSSTSALAGLPEQVQLEVNDAIGRAASGKERFQGHDGKAYENTNNLLPKGEYQEWTVAGNGQPRGPYRVIIEGDDFSSPNAIYFWDHVNNLIRIR